MGLYEDLLKALPELTELDFVNKNIIKLQDDSDGEGPYIAEWNYSKPIPDGFKLGK